MDEILDKLDKKEDTPNNRIFHIKPILYWLPVGALILLFQAMQWVGTSILILLFTAGITAYTFSGFIRLRGKDHLNNAFILVSLAWIIVLFGGAFFFGGLPFNSRGVLVFLVLFGICFGIQELIKAIRKGRAKKRG